MATDRRTYVRIHDGLPDHPKIAEVGGMAAWLYVSGLCYASRLLTDGIIPARMVARLTDLPDVEALASRLLEAKLWHPAQHDCKDCPQGLGDVYVIHDYLDHQRSAAEVRELSEKRAAAGRSGGKASGETRRAEAKAEANAKQVLQQTRSKTEAETETETEVKNQTPSSSVTATPPPDDRPTSKPKRAQKAKPVAEPRADVEALCNRLIEMMVARGCRRKPIPDTWRNEARLLLDKDGVHFQFAMDVLEWSQKSRFWKTNILSMPKFREKWDTLHQQAEEACGPHPNNPKSAAVAAAAAPGAEVVSYAGNVVALPIPGQRESATAKARAQVKASGAIARQMIYGSAG